MLLLRDAHPSDLGALRALARELDSVNLPDDPRALRRILRESQRSFGGLIRDPLRRRHVFVAEERPGGRVVGTSMVIAQHGTHASPCTFFEVSEREHYSATLDRHFRHRVLALGFHFDGPTEIGGLVVTPRRRGGPERPGRQLSLVRFLYMAAHPERFRPVVLAELMPALGRDGRSAFWEAFGRRFTGLDYQAADKLSRESKEFIQQLFPPGDLYATLLPPAVQRLLGTVGPRTRPALRLLEQLGFRPVGRIDPFDGGPHYEAPLAAIPLVAAHRRARLAPAPLSGPAGPAHLVAREAAAGRHRFRAVVTPLRLDAAGLHLPAAARRALGARPGDLLHLAPFG